jgi:hypothetical protein
MNRPLRKHGIAALLLLGALSSSPSRASDDISFTRPPSSGELDDLTRELGVAAFGAKLAAAESLGPARFEIQLGATGTEISKDEDFWRVASGGDTPSGTLAAGRGSLRVGLPWHIDLGAFVQRLSAGSAQSQGAEVKWEFVHGDTAMPAIAARVTYARLRHVDSLSAKTVAADVSISKGIGPFTPYGGVGRMWLDSKASDIESDPDAHVTSSPGVNQAFLGARLSLGWFRIHLEGQWAAGLASYAATAGFKFP